MRFAKVDTWWSPTAEKAAGGAPGPGHPSQRCAQPRSPPWARSWTPTLSTPTPDSSILDILHLVDEHNVSIVPILDEAETLCGLITKSSLMTTLSHQYLDTEKTGGNE